MQGPTRTGIGSGQECYWLLVHCYSSSSPPTLSASINLSSLIILLVSGFLLLGNANGAYKKQFCNFLESFFYLLLVAFAGSIFYANHKNGSIRVVEDTFFGLSLIVFLAILGYHFLCRLRSFKTCIYRFKGFDDIAGKEMSFNHDRAN